MQESPLTLQPRPEAFQPKIVRLYEDLFKDDDDADKTDGFWAEFFLLRPDRPALRRILDDLGPSELLNLQNQTRELFTRSVRVLRDAQGVADTHAIDTLNTFLTAVFAKKYTNPSSDIIIVLAGLEKIDTAFTDFVGALDSIIRNGRTLPLRQKAVELALAVTSGAYQTSLLTYLIQRDLFPAIIKFVQDTDSSESVFQPFILLGLLANYNKFEFQNPYQLRLNDFVNEAAIQKIIKSVGHACQSLRSDYVEVQDDLPDGWTWYNAFRRIGLGAIAPGPKPAQQPVTHDAETAKRMFSELPGDEAAILLATYDFTLANKLFSFNLVTMGVDKNEEPPFASYISLTSYLLQHAHLSQRTSLYSQLNLMVFRLLVEDAVLCKRLCSDEGKVAVRLCRQRTPYLPLVRTERVPATAVMDVMVDGITHNLRRRLDVSLYSLCVGILLRVISFLSRSRTRLAYHWAELWRALLSLIRFLTTYVADLRDAPHVETLLDLVVNLVALGLSSGEAFLPTPAAYDDLFYKVVEAGDMLVKFRDSWALQQRPSNSIATLISVSTHYQRLLAEGGPIVKGKGKGAGSSSQLTSLQVAEAIKQGYETLSIQSKEGLDSWERFREADERSLLKRLARTAVGDVKVLVGG